MSHEGSAVETNVKLPGPFATALDEAIHTLLSLKTLEIPLRSAAEICLTSLQNGNKLLVCGNGGSACEAQHLVGELVGRYKTERDPLAAIAMTSDSAVITCIGNDYQFEEIFARQLLALARVGDVFIVFSTSGNSRNIIAGLHAAKKLKLISIAFLGRDGGEAAALADCSLVVSHMDTARIQEGHQFLMHSLMDLIEVGISHAT